MKFAFEYETLKITIEEDEHLDMYILFQDTRTGETVGHHMDRQVSQSIIKFIATATTSIDD